MTEIYLGLGSNLGDRMELLQKALTFLKASGSMHEVQVSAFYETDPVGYLDQPPFLNCVLRAVTELSPEALLTLCGETEQALNRERLIRWGPRTIDVDILLYGELEMETPALTIPHPRMLERAFVLAPLNDVCSAALRESLQLEARLEELARQGVRRLENHEKTLEWNA